MGLHTLNHFSLMKEKFIDIEEAQKKSNKAVIHPDLSQSAMRKDKSFIAAYGWFNEHFDIEDSNETLISFTSGVTARTGKDSVNPDDLT